MYVCWRVLECLGSMSRPHSRRGRRVVSLSHARNHHRCEREVRGPLFVLSANFDRYSGVNGFDTLEFHLIFLRVAFFGIVTILLADCEFFFVIIHNDFYEILCFIIYNVRVNSSNSLVST